ncbi:MAG: gliding motility-associated C-terminal domain-containing protein, partial [Saprospiraceae bacterium]
NKDGVNDLLNVFAKPGMVKNIRSFRIYNRWGEQVYERFNFQPNDIAIGWDGRFRGQELNPAVFVWTMEVEFIDDVVEQYSGDVTLSK